MNGYYVTGYRKAAGSKDEQDLGEHGPLTREAVARFAAKLAADGATRVTIDPPDGFHVTAFRGDEELGESGPFETREAAESFATALSEATRIVIDPPDVDGGEEETAED
jgi:hypothetical protein